MNRKLAIAAGAALSLIIGYKAYTYLTKKNVPAAPPLNRETTFSVFNSMALTTKRYYRSLLEAKKQLYEKKGEEEGKSILKSTFASFVSDIQKLVFEKYNVKEEDFTKSLAVYFNEEDFKEVNRIFTTIEHILLDEEVVELPKPKSLTPKVVFDIFNSIKGKSKETLLSAINFVADSEGITAKELIQNLKNNSYLTAKFKATRQDVKKNELQSRGYTAAELSNAMELYSYEEGFDSTLAQIINNIEKEFDSCITEIITKDVVLPDSVTEEVILKVQKEVSEKTAEFCKESLNLLSNDSKIPYDELKRRFHSQEDLFNQFNVNYQKLIINYRNKLLSENNVETEHYNVAIYRFSQNPSFSEKVAEITDQTVKMIDTFLTES